MSLECFYLRQTHIFATSIFSELVVLSWSKQQNGRLQEAPVCCAGTVFLVLDSRCVRCRSNARGPCSGS